MLFQQKHLEGVCFYRAPVLIYTVTEVKKRFGMTAEICYALSLRHGSEDPSHNRTTRQSDPDQIQAASSSDGRIVIVFVDTFVGCGDI